MFTKIKRWFWVRQEAIEILRVIRREQLLYTKHPLFRRTLDRIQSVLNGG